MRTLELTCQTVSDYFAFNWPLYVTNIRMKNLLLDFRQTAFMECTHKSKATQLRLVRGGWLCNCELTSWSCVRKASDSNREQGAGVLELGSEYSDLRP